jgi:probable F420-dependent oxidoreductase
MSHSRPFRFGVQLHYAPTGAEWREQARKAEDLGYDTVFMPDHFGQQLAPVPALMAVADATTDLRIGALVFDNDYRHPVVLAKDCATLDVLSGGRLELGLGAGWMKSDYDQSGIPLEPAAVRVDRLEEAIKIVKGAFADGPFDHAGEHYTVTAYDGQPKPVQRPHPPLLIGGGKKRVLSLAAREADIVGINPTMPNHAADAAAGATGTAERTDEKVAWVREAAGDRFGAIELNLLVFATIVTDDREDLVEKLAPAFGLQPKEVAAYPHALIGTTGQIAEDLQRHRDRWDASYVVVQEGGLDAMAPVVAELRGQ